MARLIQKQILYSVHDFGIAPLNIKLMFGVYIGGCHETEYQ